MLLRKRKSKLVLLLLMIFMLVFSITSLGVPLNMDDSGSTTVNTTTKTTSNGSTSSSVSLPDPDRFIQRGKSEGGDAEIKASADNVAIVFIPILQTVGNVLVIITILIMGIKWMYAGPRERAMLKERLWAYVIGIAVIFCGINITALVTNYLEKL